MAKKIKIGKMWYSDFRHNGKRIRRALSPYEDKAELLLQDLLKIREVEKGAPQPKAVSWYYFCEQVLEWYKNNRKPETRYKIKRAIEVMERYGRPINQMSEMNPKAMEYFLKKWSEAGLKKETALEHLRNLKTAIKWAEAEEMINTQNWTRIKMPPYAARVEYFDYVELDKVIATAKGHWKTAAMLMAYGGLRSGEVRHLEWKDIDFKSRFIHVRAKWVIDADGKRVWWEPKESEPNKPHNRKVDMISRLEKHLEALPNRTGFVAPDEDGELIRMNTYRRFFGRMTKQLKRKGFTIKVFAHKFRHTFATLMVTAGVDLLRLAELMGHKDLRSTEIYAHLMPHVRRTAVDQMEASLPPTGPKFEIIPPAAEGGQSAAWA